MLSFPCRADSTKGISGFRESSCKEKPNKNTLREWPRSKRASTIEVQRNCSMPRNIFSELRMLLVKADTCSERRGAFPLGVSRNALPENRRTPFKRTKKRLRFSRETNTTPICIGSLVTSGVLREKYLEKNEQELHDALKKQYSFDAQIPVAMEGMAELIDAYRQSVDRLASAFDQRIHQARKQGIECSSEQREQALESLRTCGVHIGEGAEKFDRQLLDSMTERFLSPPAPKAPPKTQAAVPSRPLSRWERVKAAAATQEGSKTRNIFNALKSSGRGR